MAVCFIYYCFLYACGMEQDDSVGWALQSATAARGSKEATVITRAAARFQIREESFSFTATILHIIRSSPLRTYSLLDRFSEQRHPPKALMRLCASTDYHGSTPRQYTGRAVHQGST
jgi:hypothetical protein